MKGQVIAEDAVLGYLNPTGTDDPDGDRVKSKDEYIAAQDQWAGWFPFSP